MMGKRPLKSPSKYSGILAAPLPPYSAGLLATDEQKAIANAKVTEQLMERWNALCAHYNVPTWDSAGLAMALASEHVPAFRRAEPAAKKRKRGQPPTVDYYGIGNRVHELVESGMSRKAAYRHLAKSREFGDLSAASIERYEKTLIQNTRTPEGKKRFFREMMRRIGGFGGGEN